MRPQACLLLALGCLAGRGLAQPVPADAPVRRSVQHFHSWWAYFGNHQWSERWGLHVDAQWRRHDFVADWQQLFLRAGVDYYLPHGIRATVGYAYARTYPYGELPAANAFPEHRLWQNLQVTDTLGRVQLLHRLRPEQRWIGNSTTGRFADARFEWRFRYLLQARVPFQGRSIDRGELYAIVQDEIFLSAGRATTPLTRTALP